MTDYGLIKNELAVLLQCDSELMDKYDAYIKNSAAAVYSLLKNQQDEDDLRIVHLCAAKAYYQIALTEDAGDGIASFKAGDVSYTKNASYADNAEKLLVYAQKNCREMIKGEGFAFKAV